MPSLRTKPSRTLLVAFAMIVLPVAYVLNYAPVVRMTPVRIGTSVYAPVDWMIDNTPLREPLFWWADLWGVRDDFRAGMLSRAVDRQLEETPELLRGSYPSAPPTQN